MPKMTEQQKEAIRQDILNVAKRIFMEKGYEATSMKDIVASSGRSFGGVYLYFSNKEDVFLTLIRQQFHAMSSTLQINEDDKLWSVFTAFLEEQRVRVFNVEGGLSACLYEYFIVGRRQESRQQLIHERYQAVYASLLELIHAGVQRNQFRPTQSIDTFIHWLISSLDGLHLESIINGQQSIQLAEQFKLLEDVCHTILMPIEAEGI